MRHRWIPALTAAAAIVSVCGCSPPNIREGAAPGVRVRSDLAPQAAVRYNTVNILDDSLQHWQGPDRERRGKIAVESTNSRRTATGTLEVWGVLRNRTDHALQLEGRATFFDAQEVPI